MAKPSPQDPPQKKGFIAATASAVATFFGRDKHPHDRALENWPSDAEIKTVTPASLGGADAARARRTVYEEWSQMLRNPLVGSAIQLQVTAALGGHETSGDVLFLEDAPGISEDDKRHNDAIRADLLPLLNRIATTVATGLAGYGDAYARLYQREGEGVLAVESDELLAAPLVQPYEQGGVTRLCSVSVGTGKTVRLTMDRIVRFKMARTVNTPQSLAGEKHLRQQLETDDPDQLPLMPALAGGSLLAGAEDAYRDFVTSLAAMNGQRMIDSLDESLVMFNVTGMTVEQRKRFGANLKRIFERGRDLVRNIVETGRPIMHRVRHLIPVFNEKQVVSMQSTSGASSGAGRAGTVSIEDVMLNAKALAGKLGTDITMLGWADMLTGGWGDGGAFRMSAQTAERSRAIRIGLAEGFDHVCDVHSQLKYRRRYMPGKRPWRINFYGTISALESERQRTKADAINASALMVQTFVALKDSGLDEKGMVAFMSKQMLMDEEEAKVYASALKKSAEDAAAQAAAGGFGEPPQVEPVPGGSGELVEGDS